MLLSGKTETGRVRKTNQDAYDFGRLSEDAAFAVVCDGMGGANGGNVASSLAVKIIAGGIKAGFKADIGSESAEKLLRESVNAANAEVFAKSRSDYELNGMGTTVEACIVCGGMAYTAHAGDSRIYFYGSGGQLRQLTRDHSIVQEMVESGKITPEEAVSHPQKNIITRALGVDEDLETDFGETPFCPGDTILICSDGLTNQVSDSVIGTVLSENCDAAERLVDMANENGGSDNITVVLIKNT